MSHIRDTAESIVEGWGERPMTAEGIVESLAAALKLDDEEETLREQREEWAKYCSPDCLERADCPQAGQPSHRLCGWCDEHNRPRHHCNGGH